MAQAQVTKAQVSAILELMVAVIEVIRKNKDGFGVPGGLLYQHCMNVLDIHQFEQLMGSILNTSLVEKRGDCYHYVGPEIEHGPEVVIL